MSLVSALRNRVWRFFKNQRCKSYRKRYTNKDVSIISMNCTGGILYHDLGLKFLSPTVNMYMRAADFIKFCENLEYYLTVDEMRPCRDETLIGNRKYPLAWLDDILLFLVHYKSVEEAQQKWNERKKRINRDKIVILDNDREGMTPELMNRFEKLPYKKVMLLHQPIEGHPSCFHYLPGYEKEECVGIITDGNGWFGLRPIDKFDWVRFLNEV